MDYNKIRLANERNSHVTKRLNRLSTWKFFKVIYRENIWRMFGFNFLMILCLVPIFIMMMLGSIRLTGISNTLPLYNGFGFGTGAWFGGSGEFADVNDYLAAQIRNTNTMTGVYMIAASLLVTLVFSGGFAVIRDAFWTGKLSAVGVFKSMWKGIKANILYAFASTAVIASMIFGIYELFVYLSQIVGLLWLAIVLAVLLGIVALFVTMYLLILCSVTVTYKQTPYENLDDAWRLLWLNILPNLIHLLAALIPIALYFLFSNSLLQQIFLILMLMFGGLYFPLVWQTHMMKTFALFHPVEVKKRKKVAQEAAEARAAKAPTKRIKQSDKDVDRDVEEPAVTDSEEQSEEPADDADVALSDEDSAKDVSDTSDGEVRE